MALGETRLIQRIASMETFVSECGITRKELPGVRRLMSIKSSEIAKGVQSGTITSLVLDNVAQYYAESPKQDWTLKDCPNWSPPWPQFFAEWIEPSEYRTDDGTHKVREDREVASGCYCVAVKCDRDRSPNAAAEIASVLGYMTMMKCSTENAKGMMDQAGDAEWCLMMEYWLTRSGKPLCGRPLWSGATTVVWINRKGTIENIAEAGMAYEAGKADDELTVNMSLMVGLGLSFCHCKNVRTTESAGTRTDAWHKRAKVPRVTFKTLDINPMKEVLRTEGYSESTGLKRALHICRGHFATYTADKPLFGNVVGTVWKPSHVRGERAKGVVHKDYAVKAPTPDQS